MSDLNQKATHLVEAELVSICALYNKNYYLLDKKEVDFLVTVFQAGVGFIENHKKEIVE